MSLNPFFTSERFTQGSNNEIMVLDDMVEEAIKIFGQNFLYIPRSLVAMDEILGEDRLSKFTDAIPIEMYIETSTGFNGQNEFIQKFGLYIEQSIQVCVSRRRWKQEVGDPKYALLSERPVEGDLLYMPMMKRLFEIKYVERDTNFYQLGHLPVWKMTAELFQYASERLETGHKEIDAFESLKTLDTNKQLDINKVENFGDNDEFVRQGDAIIWDEHNPFGEL